MRQTGELAHQNEIFKTPELMQINIDIRKSDAQLFLYASASVK